MTAAAPFYRDVAEGPDDVRAVWATAEDGVRLRVAIWPVGTNGTVLLFAGRTEYAEKYGRVAADLRDMGLATICIDWRGQGLAERALDIAETGHVSRFVDYQHDVAALLAVAREQGLPEPFFLLAHSMGGCIGLRALMNDLPVRAACFTAPMWGIRMHPALRPVAWGLPRLARKVGQGHRFVIGTGPKTYMQTAEFDDNVLTSDRNTFEYMRRQLSLHPDLVLGGPSMQWLNEALTETAALADLPAPGVPCLTYVGANERVVPIEPMRDRMAGWATGRLEVVDGGEHEVLMESPQIRSRVLAGIEALFLDSDRGG